jgi:hypothetical protein
MRDFRVNIVSILGAVLFVGFGFAALRQADDLWNSSLFSLTIGFLLAAVLLAIYRTEARRAFWIGFALFGWGYLSVSLIPLTQSRLITTKPLVLLNHQSRIPLSDRPYVIHATLSLDRLRAFSLSVNDVRKALTPSRMIRSSSELAEPVLTSSESGEPVLSVSSRYNKLEQYGNIVLRANSEGEVLRLKDIAQVWLSSSFNNGGAGAGATENFVGIGHSVFALLVGWLGGVLSRRLRSVSRCRPLRARALRTGTSVADHSGVMLPRRRTVIFPRGRLAR